MLYLDIVQNIQLKIFTELDTLLYINTDLDNKQRVKQVFAAMYALMLKYPILAQIDSSTVELISRKVGIDRLGITFTCSPEVASCSFQAIYHAWLSLQSKEINLQEAVSNILLEGVIEQIIGD